MTVQVTLAEDFLTFAFFFEDLSSSFLKATKQIAGGSRKKNDNYESRS